MTVWLSTEFLDSVLTPGCEMRILAPAGHGLPMGSSVFLDGRAHISPERDMG
jgi:hypothetical protein